MKKNLIYFVTFLLSLLLYGTFVSAQDDVQYPHEIGVKKAVYVDKFGKGEVAKDSFKIVFKSASEFDAVNLTDYKINVVDIDTNVVTSEDDFVDNRGDSQHVITYKAILNSKDTVEAGFSTNRSGTFQTVGVYDTKKGYVVVFVLDVLPIKKD